MHKDIIYAFIDGQNLYESLNRKGVVFSYEKLRGYLRKKFHVSKAIMYLGDIHKDVYKKAERAGFVVKKKRSVLQIDASGKLVRKANIDVDLVVGALYEYNNDYDSAVLLTGDGDFMPLVKALVKQNRLKNIIVPNNENSAIEYMDPQFKKYLVRLSDVEEKIDLLLQ